MWSSGIFSGEVFGFRERVGRRVYVRVFVFLKVFWFWFKFLEFGDGFFFGRGVRFWSSYDGWKGF